MKLKYLLWFFIAVSIAMVAGDASSARKEADGGATPRTFAVIGGFMVLGAIGIRRRHADP